jgi:hypothetical protein
MLGRSQDNKEMSVSIDQDWGTLSKYLSSVIHPYRGRLMNLRYSIFSGIGLSAWLLCSISSAQAMPRTAPNQAPTKSIEKTSSSLGGPITLSQPDFFANTNGLVLPASVNPTLDNGLSGQPIPSAEDKSPTPLVGDPPRPTRGGIINIKTD